LVSAAAKLAAAPVKLDESSDVSIMDIRSKARRWVSEDGIRLLVVDYAGLVRGTRNYRERREEMGEVSRGVKQIAKELKIPVLLLAQLNRDIEKSENKYRVPQLSDLRDSGDFEQDAHVVAILHRPKLTAEEQDVSDEKRDWAAHSTRINLQICKQRDGPTGKVELLFEKACMRFSSYRRTKQQHEQEEM
ncbi:MAG TPA: DnaB-like helicase C-terminal domain-containing protein, partial [Verrucomicrobiae bacterium]|nr:DnaB-like helicase C-terminal domain-containing protein [Verrucomicrobiae bacterium]